MKRFCIYLLLLLTVSILDACREGEIELLEPDATVDYSYPSEQFESIWNAMLTNYVMWDVDSTDWGAVYKEYMPKFEALDEQDYVATDDLEALYVGAFEKIRDHHFTMKVFNLWMGPDETRKGFVVQPWMKEMTSRDYYHDNYLYHRESMEEHPVVAHLRQLEAQGRASQIVYGYFTNSSSSTIDVVSAVIDKRIPYIYFSRFYFYELLTNAIEIDDWASMAGGAWEYFYSNVMGRTDSQIDGVIIDLRGNGGGMILDQQFLLGLLIDKPVKACESRYKSGLGKYDYTPWTPYYFYPSEEHREGFNKPIVALVDIWSVSMAEQTSLAIKNLPNGCLIGERTSGGMGILDNDSFTYYSGILGYTDGPHYIYTIDHLNRTVDGQILEGIGITPDITLPFNETEVTNGNDTWMDRAISYIQNGY
jgi:hypothetical protein